MFEYEAPEDLLEHKVILVTGAGDGIGRAAAKSYAAHGATVILLGRTESKLEAVYDEIESADGPTPIYVQLDLETAGAAEYAQLAGFIEDEFGRLDGLLHNAALLGPMSPVEGYDTEAFARVMQVNVNAEFLLTRALLPLMRETGNASIVFTSSSVGRTGRAFWGGYAISKFATEGMMQVLAEEMFDAHGIRVNSLNPGGTRTNMRAHAYPGEDPNTNPAPEDIMPIYLYLMGKDSERVNGQALDARSGRPSPG